MTSENPKIDNTVLAYNQLFQIEIAIREFLIEEFDKKSPGWETQGDIKNRPVDPKKIQSAQSEKEIKGKPNFWNNEFDILKEYLIDLCETRFSDWISTPKRYGDISKWDDTLKRKFETLSNDKIDSDEVEFIKKLICLFLEKNIDKENVNENMPPFMIKSPLMSDKYSHNLKEKVDNSRKINLQSKKDFHLIYFMDFTDLYEFMEKALKIGNAQKKDYFDIPEVLVRQIVSGLKTLRPIRNKVAHSRILSKYEANIVKKTYELIKGFVKNFDELLDRQIVDSDEDFILEIVDKIEGKLEIERKDEERLESIYDYCDLKELVSKYRTAFYKKPNALGLLYLIEDNKDLINKIKESE